MQYRGIELIVNYDNLFHMSPPPLNNHNIDIQEKEENSLQLIQTSDTKRLTICIYTQDNYNLK